MLFELIGPLGLGIIISQSKTGFLIAQLLGSAYLCYLAFKLLTSQATTELTVHSELKNSKYHHQKAFLIGMMTNLLNPKATLFFLAIFSTIVSIETPISIKIGYALWIILTTITWFILVSFFFSQKKIRTKFISHGYIFERIMGLVLLLFAGKLLWVLFVI